MITRCLFCKESTVLSKSVEHIIPESFGSKKKVLPKGIVCDGCNRYFAIKVENPVLPTYRLGILERTIKFKTKKVSFHPYWVKSLVLTSR